VCEFGLTDWFPAKARLELAVSTNGLAENLLVQYTLQIVPSLFSFSGESEILFPFDNVDEARLTAWVEERLVSFADTYLRVEALEPYQSENLVTDPVCGMPLHKALAGGKEEHQGRTYYFCFEQCRTQFLADPARYVHEGG
jgi:YHS domain-containing protein